MVDGKIDRCGATGVVSNRNDLFEVQCLDDHFKIAQLLLEAIYGADRLVGGTVTQEIERDDPPSCRDQKREEIVIYVQVIGEAVHQHKGGADACVVASVCFSFAPRDEMLGKLCRIQGHT